MYGISILWIVVATCHHNEVLETAGDVELAIHDGLTPDIIRWFGANEINRTSSGKIARRVAKKHFEAAG